MSSEPRSWLYMVLRVDGSVLILSLLFHFPPLEQMRRALGRLPPGLWLFVLAGYLVAHSIGVVKWRLMVNRAGAQLFLPSIVHTGRLLENQWERSTQGQF